MWLITPIGFFSIVRKPGDEEAGTLTVRARMRGDLEALRDHYLPGLGQIQESGVNDYRFRAVAPRQQVAAAMAAMVDSLDYSNFKSQVAKTQGSARAHLYHDVWDVLYQLQSQSARYAGTPTDPAARATVRHPRKDDMGRAVEIRRPHTPSALDAWHRPDALACVVPGGAMPLKLDGIAVQAWADAPRTATAWQQLAAAGVIEEPEFQVPAGYKRAAGVVVRERGHVWVVAPSNGFGGYQATFPKGTVEAGMSLQATALVEAFEESGLQVRLLRHLVDVKRSQSYTRYYLAERVGGTPADMGWETQAVMLVPEARLAKVVTHPNDAAILAALSQP